MAVEPRMVSVETLPFLEKNEEVLIQMSCSIRNPAENLSYISGMIYLTSKRVAWFRANTCALDTRTKRTFLIQDIRGEPTKEMDIEGGRELATLIIKHVRSNRGGRVSESIFAFTSGTNVADRDGYCELLLEMMKKLGKDQVTKKEAEKNGKKATTIKTENSSVKKEMPLPQATPMEVSSSPSSSVEEKEKVSKEPLLSAAQAQQRAALLTVEPELRSVYEALVGKGVIGEEEFWANRHQLLEAERMRSDRQRRGKPNALLADIRPSSQTANQLTYRLTPEVVQAIFVEHPAVLSAYRRLVPSKKSEQDFWLAFLRSRNFHRDRQRAHQRLQEDIFDEFMKREENMLSRELEKNKNSPEISLEVDLTRNTDEKKSGHGSLLGGSQQAYALDASLDVIRRCNRHGQLILHKTRSPIADLSRPLARGSASVAKRAAARAKQKNNPKGEKGKEEALPTGKTQITSQKGAVMLGEKRDRSATGHENHERKKAKISPTENTPDPKPNSQRLSPSANSNPCVSALTSSISPPRQCTVERLRGPHDILLCEEVDPKHPEDTLPLEIGDAMLFFERGSAAKATSKSEFTSSTLQMVNDELCEGVRHWSDRMIQDWGTQRGADLQVELNDEASRLLMRSGLGVVRGGQVVGVGQSGGRPVRQNAFVLRKELRERVRHYHLKAQELLRHFWSCFPILSASSKVRARRLNQAINRMYDELENVHKTASNSQEERQQLHALVKPILRSLESAITHFDRNVPAENNPAHMKEENVRTTFRLGLGLK